MTENVKYLKSANQVTVYLSGKSYSMSSDSKNFGSVCSMLKKNKWNNRKLKKLQSLLSKGEEISEYFDSNGFPIKIENGVIFYKEHQIQSSIVDRILSMKEAGLKPNNLIRFVERLANNPSTQSVNELYEFLAKNNIPIREDGKFLAYKRVRHDYTDIHSGRFDNSPGNTVRLKGRADVDDNRKRTCSFGLHVCGYDYLDQFGSHESATDRVIVVAVDPADVVSVPVDYNNAKMRVVGYDVIEDIGNWREIRLKSFSVDGEDIFESIPDDEEIDFAEEDEVEESSSGLDPLIAEYSLEPEDGRVYLEDFADFHPVKYSAAGHSYDGYILSIVPKDKSAKEVIDYLRNDPNNLGYEVDNENPHSFLSYFDYVVDLKRSIDDKDRYLVVLTHRDGEEMDELRLALPSVALINRA